MTLSNNEIDKLKSFYNNKKKVFANSINYTKYSWTKGPDGKTVTERSGEPYGERYGYTLKEPYSLEKVEEFEKFHNIILDSDLKDYLTKISREIYVYSYPEVFCLTLTDIGTCQIPEDTTFIESCIENHNENCSKDCDEDDCWLSMTDGMIDIGEGGCSFSHAIVLKGNHQGTTWYCDGDYVNKNGNSFREYIFKNVL